MNERFKNVLTGTDFETIEDAIAADITSGIPVVGAITDFLRLLDSESRPQKALQALDMITSPLPLSDIFTPTNTMIYLDKRGMLPFRLDKIDEIMKKPLSKIPLLKRR